MQSRTVPWSLLEQPTPGSSLLFSLRYHLPSRAKRGGRGRERDPWLLLCVFIDMKSHLEQASKQTNPLRPMYVNGQSITRYLLTS